MNRIRVFTAILTCTAMPLLAQDTTTGQPPSPVISAGTNQSWGGLTFTNQSGQVLSVEQLATQLQSLRASVERTLPLLTQFNQQAGATNGLAGAISGLLSGVLGKDSRHNAGDSTTSGGQRLTNVLSALGALVSTNSQGGVSIDPETVRSLAALQRDLQPVADALRNLNLSATNQASGSPDPANAGGVTPTGR